MDTLKIVMLLFYNICVLENNTNVYAMLHRIVPTRISSYLFTVNDTTYSSIHANPQPSVSIQYLYFVSLITIIFFNIQNGIFIFYFIKLLRLTLHIIHSLKYSLGFNKQSDINCSFDS